MLPHLPFNDLPPLPPSLDLETTGLLQCAGQASGTNVFEVSTLTVLAKAGGGQSVNSLSAQPQRNALALHCAPNPATSEVTVSYQLPQQATVSIEILDALQRVVFRPLEQFPQNANTYDVTVPISTLPPGFYTVRLTTVGAAGEVMQEHRQLLIAR